MAESLLTDLDDSPASIPSGTVTFLFTDIQGSTQLLERLREQYALVLAEQRDLLRAIFAEWNGHEIDTQGDAFFVAFPRALDAVNCAVEAQRALSTHTWPQNVRVYVRMGLHTGEPIIARTGYVGIDVHLAARIGAAGHGGQVLMSETTRGLVHKDLPAGVSLRDLGAHKLKDIRHPQEIYQVEIEGLSVEFPPLKTLATGEEPPTSGNPPFKGMQFFDEADADLFFGRETMTAQLIERIQAQRFLTIIGASGSGKSSVVRAGVVPLLKRQQAAHWHIHVITPTSHPLEALAASLTQTAGSLTNTTTLIDDLSHDQRCLYLFSKQHSPGARLLIVVDQFEELFTLCRNDAERQAFVDNLLYAQDADASNATIVVVLRADFYEHLAQHAALREAVAKHQEYLGPMSVEELRAAIEEPAKGGGWEFSPGLVDLMLHDVGATADHQPEPGALPLLSHALLETWRRRRGNVMTLKGYSESGGVRGAIARTAETVYYTELNAEQRLIARSIFLRLTELGEGTQDTRRRASIEELFPPASFATPAQVQEVVVKLADARLITTGEGTIEVAHEALIREWSTLREWLTQNREGLRLHRHLTEAAQEWELLERDPSALYRGIRLVQALEWAEANLRELNAQEQNFLDASKELAMREETERKARQQRELEAAQKLAETEKRAASNLRRRAVYLSGALIVAAMLAVVALIFGQQSNNNAQQAQIHLAGAQTAEARAVAEAQSRSTAEANAVAESQIRATAEAVAVHEREQAQQQAAVLLASQAESELANGYHDRAVLLALEALGKYPYTTQAEHALAQAVSYNRALQQYTAHQSAITSVAWSPDGQRVASSSSSDNDIHIWDPVTGKTLTVIDMPKGITGNKLDMALDVQWTPDGKRLLIITGDRYTTGSQDYDVLLWEADTGTLISSVQIANQTQPESGEFIQSAFKYVTGAAADIASQSNRLATLGGDNTAIIWDEAWQKPMMLLSGHTKGVNSVDWSPDESQLATASLDGTVRIWDARTGKVLHVLSGHQGRLNLAFWSPDGSQLATAGDEGVVTIWNAANGKVIRSIATNLGTVYCLAWAPNGQRFITGHEDGSIRIWETESGKSLETLRGHHGIVSDLKWSPLDDRLISGDGSGFVRIWTAAWSTAWRVFPPQAARGSVWSVCAASWSNDGRVLATGGGDQVGATEPASLSFWDVQANRLTMENMVDKLNLMGVMLLYSPDNKALLFLGASVFPDFSGAASVYVFDTRTGDIIRTFTPGNDILIRSTAWSPDGTKIATGLFNNQIIIWDYQTGQPINRLVFGTNEAALIGYVEWSPDGSRFAAGGDDESSVRVWDTRTWEPLYTVQHQMPTFINWLAWSPDGTRLLTVSGNPEQGAQDNTARIWDSVTGKELLVFARHTNWIGAGDWSPNGKRVVTSGNDGTVRIWDPSTGAELLTLSVPVGFGLYTKWSPDGQHLVILGNETLVSVWRVWQSTDELIQSAKQCCVFRELTAAERQQFGLASK